MVAALNFPWCPATILPPQLANMIIAISSGGRAFERGIPVREINHRRVLRSVGFYGEGAWVTMKTDLQSIPLFGRSIRGCALRAK